MDLIVNQGDLLLDRILSIQKRIHLIVHRRKLSFLILTLLRDAGTLVLEFFQVGFITC